MERGKSKISFDSSKDSSKIDHFVAYLMLLPEGRDLGIKAQLY